jgi:hypothetical protein
MFAQVKSTITTGTSERMSKRGWNLVLSVGRLWQSRSDTGTGKLLLRWFDDKFIQFTNNILLNDEIQEDDNR